MKFRDFLKEKLYYIILLAFILISSDILLMIYNISLFMVLYITIVPILGFLICLIIEYNIKNSFYKRLEKQMAELDEKYLISEIVQNPNFIEGKILINTIQDIDKSMLENVNKYKHLTEDYKEYIELWIHEIKIPIATSKLIIENNKSKETKSIDEELGKIENFVEQVLYYARSNNVEKDYYISKTKLSEIVNGAILKNKNILLSNKINLEIGDIDKQVVTDSKWTIFILNQIIQNSVKYMNKDIKTMKIYAEEKKEKVILYIQDNGMGVGKGEIARVYDKGFTGENGRILGKKSTGIGLYLCKKLCDRLGLGIEFNSQKDIGTEVKIIFPVGSHTNI
mgnify:CR=1 FL=1